MWRPRGYVPLPEVASRFLFHVEKVIFLACLMADNDDEAIQDFLDNTPQKHIMYQTKSVMVRMGYAENCAEAEISVFLIFTLLLSRFIEINPPILASLTGGKIEIGDNFFWHMDQLELCYPSWPILDSPEFFGFKSAARKGGFTSTDLLNRFTFLDIEKGCLFVKNGTIRQVFNLYEATEAKEALNLVDQLKDFNIFWERWPTDEEFGSVLTELLPENFFENALKSLFDLPEASLRKVKTKISDEREAEREARMLLTKDSHQTLRKGSLRDAVSVELGERAWSRVIARLRPDFPYISIPGAPRKYIK